MSAAQNGEVPGHSIPVNSIDLLNEVPKPELGKISKDVRKDLEIVSDEYGMANSVGNTSKSSPALDKYYNSVADEIDKSKQQSTHLQSVGNTGSSTVTGLQPSI